MIEIGAGQRSAVSAILARAGLVVHDCAADLAGTERCLVVGIKTELTHGP